MRERDGWEGKKILSCSCSKISFSFKKISQDERQDETRIKSLEAKAM